MKKIHSFSLIILVIGFAIYAFLNNKNQDIDINTEGEIQIPQVLKGVYSSIRNAQDTMSSLIKTNKLRCFSIDGAPLTIRGLFYELILPKEASVKLGASIHYVKIIPVYIAQAEWNSSGIYEATFVSEIGDLENEIVTFQANPFCGYWFHLLSMDSDGTKFVENKDGFFAVCAFPEKWERKKDNLTYLLGKSGIVYMKDTGGKYIDKFPSIPEDDGWIISP